MKPSSTSVALKWAVISLLTTVVITYLFQFLNVDQSSAVKYIGLIPFVAFLFLAQKEFKEQLGGYISYGDAFVAGLFFSLFAGLFGAVFTYLYFAILSPAEFEKILAAAQAQMEAKGNTPEQIEAGMNVMKKGGVLITAFFGGVFTIIMGVIVSLITAAILKKERSALEIAEANEKSQFE